MIGARIIISLGKFRLELLMIYKVFVEIIDIFAFGVYHAT